MVGSSVIKGELYGWLRQNKAEDGQPDPYGYCHFPQYGPDFFKMLTGEQLVSKIIKGYKRTEWQKIRDRNEALDCRVYARAAASVVGLDRLSNDQLKLLAPPVTRKQSTNEPTKPSISQPIKRRESSYL